MLPAGTHIGAVHLTVSDLGRSLEYYRSVFGLEPREREDGRASLAAGDSELLVLVEEPDARPAPHTTGLYHFALLVPQREDLARWLAHAARERIELTGLSDHEVSEAIYLRDPDGHGIEIYADRPRELWEGQVDTKLTTIPLDVQSLLGELDDPESAEFDRIPDETVMGHVHLKVRDVPEAIGFYRDVLGFDLMAQLGDQAAFLSAAGYHHHIGANVWESKNAPPPPAGSASLRSATIVFPSAEVRDPILERVGVYRESERGHRIQDLSGNVLVLAVE